MKVQWWLGSSVFAAVVVVALSAQAPSARGPTSTFSVASVKRNLSGPFGTSQDVRPGGVFTAINQALARLIAFAYRIDDFRVVGGPDWVREHRFDVEARAGGNATNEQIRSMMRSLLEDRFKLVAHPEQREMPVYVLSLLRGDGRLGANLRPIDDCAKSKRGASESPPAAATVWGCGSISVAVSIASSQLGMPVIDKTGLTGFFDVFVYYTSDGARFFGEITPPRVANPESADVPSFTTAVREQLGLKLESTRGPVDVIVIDSIQPPTEN